ncbi:MAG: ABC transporter ATP-binding protein [Candidatus Omnitrophota bacterium]
MFSVKGITCGYGSKIVLEGIDLSVARGEFFGVIGPNGSGKTTLLRAMARVLNLQQGEIFLNGEDIWRIPLKDFARKVAVVSQTVPSVPMTVEEFVLLGRLPHYRSLQFLETEKDNDAAEHSMRVTGIEALRGRLMDQLSGGERQLAAIARALAQEPEWLFLDEPTAHLDIAHQVRILDFLLRLNQSSNLTLIMVLHDLNLAGEYCRKLLLMRQGRTHKTGSAEEVLDRGTIENVYGTPVAVGKNPLSSRPFVLPVPAGKQAGRERK